MTVRPDSLGEGDFPAPFGRYTLLGLLGEGGMARVFRAELQGPDGFRKQAAIKIVHASVAARGERLRRALSNEARVGGLLHHPNVVETYEYGEIDGLPYIAMEYVRGVGLDDLLRLHGALPAPLALRIALQVCAGLAHAHELLDDAGRPIDLVHRDLKPSNVILSRDGGVKVMDFGIAKATGHTQDTTEAGSTKGTPAYMSPEQAEGRPLDGRSDLFAVGAILYEMLTGRRLFRAESMVGVLMAVVRVEELLTDRARWEAVDAALPGASAVLKTCLRRDPGARFEDARALTAELERLARGLPAAPPLARFVREAMQELHGASAASSGSLSAAAAPEPVFAAPSEVRPAPLAETAPARPPVPFEVPPSSGDLPAAPAPATLWSEPRAAAGAERRWWGGLLLGLGLGLLGAVATFALLEGRAPDAEEGTVEHAVPAGPAAIGGDGATGSPAAAPEPVADGGPPVEPGEATEPETGPETDAEPTGLPEPSEIDPTTPPRRNPKIDVKTRRPPGEQAPAGLELRRAEADRVPNDDGSTTLRFRVFVAGEPPEDVRVFLRPARDAWQDAPLRRVKGGLYAVDVRLPRGRSGAVVWYLEAKDAAGAVTRDGSRARPNRLR